MKKIYNFDWDVSVACTITVNFVEERWWLKDKFIWLKWQIENKKKHFFIYDHLTVCNHNYLRNASQLFIYILYEWAFNLKHVNKIFFCLMRLSYLLLVIPFMVAIGIAIGWLPSMLTVVYLFFFCLSCAFLLHFTILIAVYIYIYI